MQCLSRFTTSRLIYMTKKLDGKTAMTLSIRLLRQGKKVDDALRDDHGLQERPAEGARLFVQQTSPEPPSWFSFIGEFSAAPLAQLQNMSCGAVVFVFVTSDPPNPVTRSMALTFGSAWHALDPNAFERNFGLRVALNSTPRANLKGLDVATLDATTMQRRVQASRKSDLSDFGIDYQRDLLRLATGIPTDRAFAASLSGKDVLTLRTRTSRSDVMKKCKKALKLFGENHYKKDYAWIDYISPVRDDDRIADLDALAFEELERLVAGSPSDLHLAFPDVISPNESHEIGYFGVGLRPGSKETFLELAIDDYVGQLRAGRFSEIANMSEIKNSHHVAVIEDGRRNSEYKKRIYECFVYELTDAGRTYVLFAGDWYLVDPNFHAEVERDFKAVLKPAFIPFTECESERELIAELDKNPDLLNLDQVKISPVGATGANLEPCDFFSRTRQFIHLKDGHSSAPISHLWNQGVVAAEAFVRDEGFRKTLRKEAIKRQNRKPRKTGFETILPDGRSKPIPADYTIVFGIMRTPYAKSGALGLPFFSKVSLRSVVSRIQTMSYPVELHIIERRPKGTK